jgi:hypothetical protein
MAGRRMVRSVTALVRLTTSSVSGNTQGNDGTSARPLPNAYELWFAFGRHSEDGGPAYLA